MPDTVMWCTQQGGVTRDDRSRLQQVGDDDRGRGPCPRGPAGLLRRRGPAQHRGQPRPADGRARYRAGLRGGRLRGAPPAAAAQHRRPDDRHRLDRRGQHARAVRLLPPGRPHRRRLPGRRPDRPLREHQHDRDRRLRPPDDAAARFRRCMRDRDQRPSGVRDHAPVGALVRRVDRLPDVARQPRRGRAGRAHPARGRLAGPRPDGRRDRPRASTGSTTAARCGSTSLHPARPSGRGPGDHRLGDHGRRRTSARRRRRPTRSCG